MYIIAIESSKTRGMGHLFRSLLYAEYLNGQNKPFIILINNDEKSIDILKKRNIPFEIVNYADESDWVTAFAEKYKPAVWLQDKFETTRQLASNIKKNGILLCAIDEFGPGAELFDLHFAGMIYLTGHKVLGKKKYCGAEYIILNSEIDKFKKKRTKLNSIIISLGGSDPYGMTVDIVKTISNYDYSVEIIIGPDFDYRDELEKVNVKNYPILQNVPSLIEEFSKFDLAITGGGVTCCEANACGIPCIIIANAPHEKHTGAFMQENGGAIYAGSYEGWNSDIIKELNSLQIEKMSEAGMKTFDTKAIERIFTTIEQELVNEGR